ncbi:MAG TPA: M48 family metalloprotease, partial [Steroidobacteraceae bacterium]|nr:M48 family metalloprotease [Steroidobacteraceae bacterium]
LIQGVVNTFVVFLSRIVGSIVDRAVFRTEEGHGPAFFVVSIVAQLVFGILASVIVMAFSRRREFRADRGGAELAGTSSMVGALERLMIEVQRRQPQGLPEKFQAFGISGGKPTGFKRLFMSHPPLEDRIAALRSATPR